MAKKSCLQIVSLLGGLKCGAFPIDRDKPSPDAIRYPVNMLKRAIVLFLCFQVEVGIRKRSKEG